MCGHCFGSETSAHMKSLVNQHSVWLGQSLPVVVAKAYAMNATKVRRCIQH